MKNVLHIFGADIRALSRQFLAMAVVIAILFIPALYAWLNIYANWDPYGNTGNITIAVASEDAGYVQDGVMQNKGQELLKQLDEKDSINFVVFDDVLDAMRSAESGESYGAIIIGENFSRNMYDLSSALSNPDTTITFYENYKLNAVANKIMETAASSVVQSVQTAYLQVLFETVFGTIGNLVDEVENNIPEDAVLNMVIRLRDASEHAVRALDTFNSISTNLADFMYGVDMSGAADGVRNAAGGLYTASEAVAAARDFFESRMNDASATISGAQAAIGSIDVSAITQEWIDSQREVFNQILELADQLETVDPDQAEQLRQKAQEGLDALDQLEASGGNSAQINATLQMLSMDIVTMGVLLDGIQDTGLALLNGLVSITSCMGDTLVNLSDVANDITSTTTATGNVIYALNDTMGYLRALMVGLNEKLNTLVEHVEDLSGTDVMTVIRNVLNSDTEQLAEFFAEPVVVETIPVYYAATYGTAMAPFYSVLAVWVGCVVLAAVIRVDAKARELQNVTPNQLYWSRFLLFLLLNEIQTMIIMAGDLYLLKISCVHPALLFLVGAFTSLVFTSLIYSLVLSFGDIGKAIVVVTMVLQIAGSGGTYPIEILSNIFSRLYLFFPFPYAINAMREAVCGMYRLDIVSYLAELSVFGIMGILIGLFVRKPFMNITEFIEEEMERSGVL